MNAEVAPGAPRYGPAPEPMGEGVAMGDVVTTNEGPNPPASTREKR